MGTNYYLHTGVCPHCGRSQESLHIGKSSAGWCFALHVIPEAGIKTLDDWQKKWAQSGSIIKNEYSEEISAEEMLAIITERSWARGDLPMGYESWDQFRVKNSSADGPNGLVRCVLGGRCIGHGGGTWDLIIGEFS
jgi:hypothetical protein